MTPEPPIALTPTERDVLTRLQRGIALEERPFQGLPLTEDEVVALLRRARRAGLVRRFGAVFDARRLGYRSVLCGLDVGPERIEQAAAVISAHPGVTHCYERRPPDADKPCPSLWFTLALPRAAFESGLAALRSRVEPDPLLLLPAVRRFKIDVVFDLRTRERDESVPECTDAPSGHPAPTTPGDDFTEDDRALVRLLDGDVPVGTRPFDAIAAQLELPVAALLERLRHWRQEGLLRRFGVVLFHREAGFKANGMCVWPVDDDVVAAGRRVAARREVTHCYQRPRLPGWPFDLYAMIHTGTPSKTQALFAGITRDCGLPPGELLLSRREFKKSSMRYFRA